MKNYMDDSFVIADKTIIAYCGQHPTLKLPPRFADMEVAKIGNGSFMESSELQCIVLPPQIKEIGREAFSRCPKLTSIFVPGSIESIGERAFSNCGILSDITIYGLEITASEYFSFINASNKCYEDTYVLREMPKHPLIQQIVSAVDYIGPACYVPDGITSLFQLVSYDEEKGCFSLDKNIPVIGFSVPSVSVTENNAFCEHIKNSGPEIYDGDAEQKNDWYVRVGKIPFANKSIIFTFDDSKTRVKNDKFVINATLKTGFFFWQSMQTVIYDKKKYYVYRRYYLSPDSTIKYVRRDIALYTDNGLVNSREEAQKVYAKYKLLSIL